tara:strand:+ start:109 stop:894 length:786 start_codon:yes stop_codon:yes gene_type:complete
MKLIDCFLYHNEDLVLDIRLNTLNEHVDQFVIVESNFDHQGNKKRLNFDFERFKKFKHKINYQVIEKFPGDISNWERENYQRNFIENGISDCDDNDYIIISDVDEIPDLKKIKNLQNNKFTVFQQKMFYYKFNLLNVTDPFWYGTKICKKKYLKSPQWLRDQKVKKYSFWKFYKIKWNIIKDGGWHFSFLMNAEQIKSKIESYAHAEFNNKNFNNLEKINFSLENQVDLFDRKIEFEKIVFDETFPKYILNNKEKYKNWIL